MTAASMLKALDEVPWATVAAVKGMADEVPVLVRQLASAKAGAAAKLCAELLALLMNDRHVSVAAVYTVPFLIELAATKQLAARAAIVRLLAELATGGHAARLVADDLPKATSPKGAPKTIKGKPDAATLRTWSEAAVREGENVYLKWLDESDAELRSAAAFVLAFAGSPKEAAPKLVARVRKERDTFAQASQLLALGVLERRAESTKHVGELVHFTGDIPEEWPKPPPEIVSRAAVIGLGLAQPSRLSATMLRGLRAKKQPSASPEQLPWNGGDLRGLAAALLSRFEAIDVAAELRALVELKKSGQTSKAKETAFTERWLTLVDRVFAAHAGRDKDPLLPEELDADQRLILEYAIKLDGLNSPQHGLRLTDPFGSGVTLKRFLATKPGPLETRLKLGKAGPWPIWKWFHLVAEGKARPAAVKDAILAALEPQQVIELARDATTMAYATVGEGQHKQSPRAVILLEALDALGAQTTAKDLPGIRHVLEQLRDVKWPGSNWKGGPVVPPKPASKSASPTVSMRRFIAKGKPAKFVDLEVGGNNLVISRPGKYELKPFGSPADARAEFERLSRENLSKGMELALER